MNKTKKPWDQLLPFNRKEKAINEIIRFFEEEKGEKIGIIAAELALDFFLENIGRDVYEKGVEDSKEVLKNRFSDLELDLDLLLNK